MLSLVQGTIENVNITITDPTGVLTTLDDASPTYSVIPVKDEDTDEEYTPSEFFLIYDGQSALNASMMMQCLIDTTTGGTIGGFGASVLADSAPNLPLTVVPGTNDQFNDSSIGTITVPGGTYTTIAQLIAALEAGSDGTYLVGEHWYDIDSIGGKLRFTYKQQGLSNDGNTVSNGTPEDILADLGFTDPQTFYGGTDPTALWARGKYHLYVSFTYGSEIPKLGPVELFVV